MNDPDCARCGWPMHGTPVPVTRPDGGTELVHPVCAGLATTPRARVPGRADRATGTTA